LNSYNSPLGSYADERLLVHPTEKQNHHETGQASQIAQ